MILSTPITKKNSKQASQELTFNLKLSIGIKQNEEKDDLLNYKLVKATNLSKGFATRSENLNEVVSITSYLRKIIVTTTYVNDFVQGGRVELYRLVALYRCILIG